MNTDSPHTHDEVLELIPEFVLGALTAPQVAAIERHLADCRRCSGEVDAASVIHRVGGVDSVPPSTGLRNRALAAAFEARAPVASVEHVERPEPAAWGAEVGRVLALLDDPRLGRDRTDSDHGSWHAMCVARFDLTIRSMVCHLIATESLWARQLGAPVEGIPETQRDIEARTRAVIDRHGDLPVSATIDEYDLVTDAVLQALRALDDAALAQPSAMVPGFSVSDYAALRALEIWTHADDIRLALDQRELSPEEIHLTTMTSVLPRWIAIVAELDETTRGRHYRVDLTGPGGQRLDVLPPATDGAESALTGPEAIVTCDAIEFCKLAAARREAESFVYEASGDRGSARALVSAIAAFEVI